MSAFSFTVVFPLWQNIQIYDYHGFVIFGEILIIGIQAYKYTI